MPLWPELGATMDNGRYIWCRSCGAVHHVTPFDRAPRFHGGPDEFREEPANDWREFMNRHEGHRLEPMVAVGSSDGLCVDPMGVHHFEISNGSETLLVRRSRRGIEEPFCYTLVEGRLTRSGASLGIQEEAIRREMKLHFSWAPAAPLTDEKIDRFLCLFREVVQSLHPDRAQESLGASADGSVAYCELDETTAAALTAKCERNFQWGDLEALQRFIATHRQADDVLALVKRRVIAIEKSSERCARQAFHSDRR